MEDGISKARPPALDYIEKVSATLAPYGPDSDEAFSKGGVKILYPHSIPQRNRIARYSHTFFRLRRSDRLGRPLGTTGRAFSDASSLSIASRYVTIVGNLRKVGHRLLFRPKTLIEDGAPVPVCHPSRAAADGPARDQRSASLVLGWPVLESASHRPIVCRKSCLCPTFS